MDASAILGTISATTGLIDQSVRLIQQVRGVFHAVNELSQSLELHETQLSLVLPIVRAIQDEEALQTAIVTLQINNIKWTIEQVNARLKELRALENNRSGLEKVWYQLTQGKDDEKTLADYMKNLGDSKTNLGLTIQLATVGLIKSKDNSKVMLAEPEVIRRTDRVLVEVLGEDGGLRLAQLIRGREPGGDGRVAVEKAEIACLYEEFAGHIGDTTIAGTASTDPGRVERLIIANSGRENSIMINAPLGNDMWKDVTVKIMSNETTGNALMVNFPTTMDDTDHLMDRQDATMEKAWQARKYELDMEFRKLELEHQERREMRELEYHKEN